jgi:hypothetical protein
MATALMPAQFVLNAPGRGARPTLPATRRDSRCGGSGRLVAALTLAIATAIGLGACGSSSPTAASSAGSESAALAAAECMRAHGVPNFPDPGPNGGMTVLRTPDSSTVTINGILISGPAFQGAERICKALGNPGGGRPPVTEQQKRTLLDFARCIRQHGIAYADPQFPAGGGTFGGGSSGQDKNSPAFKHAATICNQAMRSQSAG